MMKLNICRSGQWKGTSGLFLNLVILSLVISCVQCSTEGEKIEYKRDATAVLNAAHTGIQIGQTIATFVEQKNFTSALTTISKSVSTYLGAIGSFIGIFLSLIPHKTAEQVLMEQLKKMMAEIDNRFDKIDQEFDDVKRLIKWSTLQTVFIPLENKINALGEDFKLILSTSGKDQQNRKQRFINNHENHFDDSGYKLYHDFLHKGVFQNTDLGQALMQYTQNDRGKVQVFLLGIMKLLVQAAKLDIAYYHLNEPASEASQIKLWNTRLHDVQKACLSIDYSVKNKWLDQSEKDMNNYLTSLNHHSNAEFATKFHAFLAKKYYWRDWLVVAYNPISGGDNHWVLLCGGHGLFRQGGRNLVFASVDKTHHGMNMFSARSQVSSAKQSEKHHHMHDYYRRYHADAIFNTLNRSGVCATGVIKADADVHVVCGNPARLALQSSTTPGHYFFIFMFG